MRTRLRAAAGHPIGGLDEQVQRGRVLAAPQAAQRRVDERAGGVGRQRSQRHPLLDRQPDGPTPGHDHGGARARDEGRHGAGRAGVVHLVEEHPRARRGVARRAGLRRRQIHAERGAAAQERAGDERRRAGAAEAVHGDQRRVRVQGGVQRALFGAGEERHRGHRSSPRAGAQRLAAL